LIKKEFHFFHFSELHINEIKDIIHKKLIMNFFDDDVHKIIEKIYNNQVFIEIKEYQSMYY
jgi:hypothetical protein